MSKRKYIFIADMFLEDYTGGAELSTGALVDNAAENNILAAQVRSHNVILRT